MSRKKSKMDHKTHPSTPVDPATLNPGTSSESSDASTCVERPKSTTSQTQRFHTQLPPRRAHHNPVVCTGFFR